MLTNHILKLVLPPIWVVKQVCSHCESKDTNRKESLPLIQRHSHLISRIWLGVADPSKSHVGSNSYMRGS